MAYAVFKDDQKLSRTFPTKKEALKNADEAGLVDNTEGTPVLENDLTIKPCAADPERRSDEISTGRLTSSELPIGVAVPAGGRRLVPVA